MRPGAAVGEEVAQLLGDVAVVHVHRRDPGLVRAEHRLEVLVAVVGVDGQVILVRLVPGEPGPALGSGAEAAVVEDVGEPPGALGHVGVAEAPIAEHDARAVGDGGGDRLVHDGEVEIRRR